MKKRQIVRTVVVWGLLAYLAVSCFPVRAAEWKMVAEWPKGAGKGWINQLVIDPSNPNKFYAATEGAGILVSEDGGSTWTPRNEGLTKAEEGTVSGYHVRCLALDPRKPGVMYAGMAAFGVFKTVDDGVTWVDMNKTLGDTFIKVLAIHPKKPDVVYLGTDGGGIYRCTDGSANWVESIRGMRNTYVKAIVMDPKDPNVIYVGTDGGIAKTTNGGDDWVVLKSGLRYVLCMAIDPKNTDVLYVGTDNSGLSKTEDAGNSWVKIGGDTWLSKSTINDILAPGEEALTASIVSSVVVNPVNTSVVYAANPSGFFRSSDAGQSWTQINGGLSNTEIKMLAIGSKEPVTVYAGTADGKLFAFTED